MVNDVSWIRKVEDFCYKYNIPTEYLAEVLNEPKVVPMLRGKAFEFTVMMALDSILPKAVWQVDKPAINAQFGSHDMDVRVRHLPTGTVITPECKLAANMGVVLTDDGYRIRVKCMRSRTLGTARAALIGAELGIPTEVVMVHNDQYTPRDFDLVITSIGNAFYSTDIDTGLYEWNPSATAEAFLRNLIPSEGYANLKDLVFNKMYVARSSDLPVSPLTGVTCTRQKCEHRSDCGFIPNYPLIIFDRGTLEVKRPWVPIEDSVHLFESIVKKSTGSAGI